MRDSIPPDELRHRNERAWLSSLYIGIGTDLLTRVFPVVTDKMDLGDVIRSMGTEDLLAIGAVTLIAKGAYNLFCYYKRA